MAYVVFGGNSFSSTVNLGALSGSNGFQINGMAASNQLGYSVSSAGDVNGDGRADVIVGAPSVASNTGAVYVIFGGNSFSSTFNLATLSGTNGFKVSGLAASDQLGYSVSSAGDVNGDGRADVIIGAPSVASNTGAVYVIFGGNSFSSTFNLATLSGTNGFKVSGLAVSGQLGYSVSSAGDINGDGKADIIIGSTFVLNHAGQAYVIFGQSTPFVTPFDLRSLNGMNGFTVNGLMAGDMLGWSVSSAGDVNGDGKADIIIAAENANPNGLNSAGQAYIIFGESSVPTSYQQVTCSSPNSLSSGAYIGIGMAISAVSIVVMIGLGLTAAYKMHKWPFGGNYGTLTASGEVAHEMQGVVLHGEVHDTNVVASMG